MLGGLDRYSSSSQAHLLLEFLGSLDQAASAAVGALQDEEAIDWQEKQGGFEELVGAAEERSCQPACSLWAVSRSVGVVLMSNGGSRGGGLVRDGVLDIVLDDHGTGGT